MCAFLWKRRTECPGGVPALVCREEMDVERDAEQAADQVQRDLERISQTSRKFAVRAGPLEALLRSL